MSRVMTLFYIRWGIILLVILTIAVLGYQRYQRDVASLTPDQILEHPSNETVRISGMIQGGSLTREDDGLSASFSLQGNNRSLIVRYHGQDTDSLRDLKVVVVTGRMNAKTAEFEGETLSLVSNYGFVAVSYLLGILPTCLFLFLMERKLRLLYTEVKEAKLYEPEVM